MLEKTPGSIERILAPIFEEERTFLLERPSRKEEKRIMRELAKKTAHKMLQSIGYDFRFYPTPLSDLARFLSIRGESSKRVVGAAELYKNGSKWTVVHRQGTFKQRRRFSLAHEIGHVLLSYVPKYVSTLNGDGVEEFCDLIAADLLVPTSLFQDYGLDEVRKIIGSVARSRNRVPTPDGLPRLDFNTFEAIRKHLCVSRPLLVRRLDRTRFLDDCESGVIISWETVNRFTGRSPDLRTIYTASPTWGFIPANTRLRSMGLFSALNAFGRLSTGESEKWAETIKVREKRIGWRSYKDTIVNSYGEHVVCCYAKGNNRSNKYMVTTLGLKMNGESQRLATRAADA